MAIVGTYTTFFSIKGFLWVKEELYFHIGKKRWKRIDKDKH